MSLGRVLITGGAGTVGSAIADAVVRAGAAEVIVFDQMTRGRPENLRWAVEHGPVQLVAGDIRDRDAVADVMAGISVVFHQAAIRITQCAEEPRLAHEVLVDGTFNVAEAAVSAGVGKVVLADGTEFGTGELIGDRPSVCDKDFTTGGNESTACRPDGRKTNNKE